MRTQCSSSKTVEQVSRIPRRRFAGSSWISILVGIALASSAFAQADFTITSVKLIGDQEPTKVYVGGTFSAEIVVKNVGTRSGDAGYLDVWANKSSAPVCRDKGEKYVYVGTLSPGQSKTYRFLRLSGGATYNGWRYFRAFIDSQCGTAESNENNNKVCLSYLPVAPDFVITSISLSPATPVAGRWFTVKVTVKNIGTRAWYKWWDNNASDVHLDMQTRGHWWYLGDWLTQLNPGESYILSSTEYLSPAGTYQFVATADSHKVVPELNEGNNTLSKKVYVSP